MVEVSQELLTQLMEKIETLQGQVESLEFFRNQHMGTDAGQSGFNYPHPNQKVNVLEFGNGTLRLDKNGIQLISDNVSSVSIYGLRTTSLDPVNAAVQTRLTLMQTVGYALMSIGAYDFTNSRFATFSAYANSNGNYVAPASTTFLALSDGGQNATIASGAITATGSVMIVDTEGGAGTDDLDTINSPNASSMSLLWLIQADSTHDIVVKHGTGNINLRGSVDYTMTTNAVSSLLLIKYGTTWMEIGRAAP